MYYIFRFEQKKVENLCYNVFQTFNTKVNSITLLGKIPLVTIVAISELNQFSLMKIPSMAVFQALF